MLSGIGPAAALAAHSIPVLADASDVGQHLVDHYAAAIYYKVRNVSAGWALGSSNPILDEPQYGFGLAIDFNVQTDVPKAGLAHANALDEGGAQPNPMTHPLLAYNRTFAEYFLLMGGVANGSRVLFGGTGLLPTAPGTMRLASAEVGNTPLIDPNYLGTIVDRYVIRRILRTHAVFGGSEATVVGREILDGEDPLLSEGAGTVPIEAESSDAFLDARARAAVHTSSHPHGPCAMGKVIDADLRVKGVNNLRVSDASIFPVAITAHLQLATCGMAEQAAVIIGGS